MTILACCLPEYSAISDRAEVGPALALLVDEGRIVLCVSSRLMILFHSGECASFTRCGKVALNVAVAVGMSLKIDPKASWCSAKPSCWAFST